MTESRPSLLEKESRGGDIAQGGFSFQEQVILSFIPQWLAQDGFTAMTHESMGDIESKFFVPGRGYVMEFVEVKENQLTPTKFWEEIQRFQEIDSGSPETYTLFTLIAAGLSSSVKPVTNALSRVRDVYRFYESAPAIQMCSLSDYIQTVQRQKHTEEEARFLFEKVSVESNWSMAHSKGEALFTQALADHLPKYENLSVKTTHNMYTNLGAFIRAHRNQPVSRVEIEEKLRECIPPNLLLTLPPVHLYTSIKEQDDHQVPGLRFGWASFFGGLERKYPPPKQWNQKMLKDLEETRAWIIENRSTKRIMLTGSRRLSASLAIGSIFSAVAGFSIEMKYREELWATDIHPLSNTPAYPLSCNLIGSTGDHLVVGIGILCDVAEILNTNLERLGLENAPRLYIRGTQAIVSPQHTNVAVRAIKEIVLKTLAQTDSHQIHLFLAGPAPLALFLGHRLNATAPIQCYELDRMRRYVPTCKLWEDYRHD